MNLSIATTPHARYGCNHMAKVAKVSVASSKPALPPTVTAVLSDFVSKLADEKILDDAPLARLKKALLEDHSADVASLTAAMFGDDGK